ncbi:MAG: FAD-dependent oxidoreductase, partial [Simkania sp.]|nr:FAD-dependent oxidoreductase [Simkania sp.]
MSEKVKIAIVGASFAGLRAYISLKKRFPKAIFYLFDKEDYFTFIPSLHLSLCRPSHLQKSQFSLKRYFGEAFIHEEVISIKDHLIETKKKTYAFDYAVISTGAKVNYFGNDDLKKHALGAKSVPHLKVLHKRLPAAKKIVIIGGGLSGVEYAAMLGATSDKEVTLINGADRLLPAILPKAGAYANRYLEKKGVKVIHDAKAVSATEKKVVLDSGEEIPADMIMMCTGLKQFCPLLDSSPI